MLPSDFTSHPYDSVLHKSEPETIMRNIMVILSRTGNAFRRLTWDEYKQERLNDGNFTESEKQYFDQVIDYSISEIEARKFSPAWESSEHARE